MVGFGALVGLVDGDAVGDADGDTGINRDVETGGGDIRVRTSE